jgi:epsilon-lactone hydrolase
MASEQATQLARSYASVRERVIANSDLRTIRDICETLHAASSEPEGVSYAEVTVDGVPALWCVPQGYDPDKVLLHGHAGGSVVFSMHTDRKAVGHLAKAAGIRALIPDFRRSPESTFPAQHDDWETAYRWLLARGFEARNIAVGGQSVGANLAVSLAIKLRDRGAPLPAAIVAISPWFDIDLKSETVDTNAGNDNLLARPLLEFFRESWLGGTGVAYDDPRVNLLYADLTGLPPVSIYYGQHELFAGESIEFASRAKDAGLDVTLESVPEGQHSFIFGAGRVPETDNAIQDMGRWLRSRLDS